MELLVIGLLGTIDLVATLMDLIGIAQECKRSIDLVAVLIGSNCLLCEVQFVDRLSI